MIIYEDTNPKLLLDLIERMEAGDIVFSDFQPSTLRARYFYPAMPTSMYPLDG